jgi:Transport and Golgi organisation 2
MCTVTFIPSGDNLYFTSSRDEKSRRKAALAPAVYPFNSGNIIFPKDGEAGGTWIAAHENGNVVVFLNGAFIAHTAAPPYRKSRGLILLDLIDHPTPYNCFLAIKINNIEPFTAIIRDNNRLFECRWDGHTKHYSELDISQPMIWSSVTLYSDDIVKKRKAWFDEWIAKNDNPSQTEIINFHRFGGDGDETNDFLMNRDGIMRTVSITSAEIAAKSIDMLYVDITADETFSEQLCSDGTTASW